MNRFLGAEGGQVIQMIGALLVVVVLIVLFAWAMRRFGAGGRKQPAARGGRPTQRLAVVDAAHVDGQRRLVLVRRDDVEHLVMIGGPNDVLIEPRIVRGQPLGGQRAAPQAVPYPTAAVPGAPNVAAPQPQQVRATAQQPQPGQAPTVQPHTGQPQQAPAAAAAPGQVPMPPPFVEPVTSPAAPHRANPIAADLRAAMGDGRRADDYADTQRDGYAGRQPTAPQSGTRQQQAAAHGAYDEPTVAAPRPYAGEPAPYVAPPRPAASTRQSSAPASGSAPSLEDMVAAGLEQAISRPDPAPTRSGRGQGPAFGQRVEPSAYDIRTPAKDAVAAEIEKAIYGLTAPGAPAARPQSAGRQPPSFQQPPRRDERQDRHQDRHEPEATVAIGRMPQATAPVFPRSQPATLRPTLVAQQDAEPVVAVLPQPDAVRADGRPDPRRSSSDIEDEMARLLSELTGTAGR